MMGARVSGALAAAVLVGGCASMKPGKGFEDVQKEVSERAGARVHWNNGSAADAEAGAAVDEMLAHDLSVDEAVQIALLNNHDLQAEYEELDLAQADIVQAGLLKNPVFDAQIRFAEAGAGTGVDLALTEDFLTLLYMPLQERRAGAEFDAAKLRVTGAVMDLAWRVREACYELQAAEEARAMHATVVDVAGASYELGKRIRNAGGGRELDVLNVRALYEQSKLDLAGAEADASLAHERLSALMGLWGPRTGWRIAGPMPAPPEEEVATDGLEARAIERSLDLGVLRREMEVASRTLGVAGPFAFLDGASVGAAASRELDGTWSLGPAFSLPIPLFDQGQGRAGAAHARLRQASERYTATAVEIRSRVRAEAAATEAARQRAVYYGKVMLPLRQKIVEETQLQYNAMQVSPFQLLQARRDEIEAQGDRVRAVRDYWLARSRLEQALGGRTTPAERTGSGASGSEAREAGLQGGHR